MGIIRVCNVIFSVTFYVVKETNRIYLSFKKLKIELLIHRKRENYMNNKCKITHTHTHTISIILFLLFIMQFYTYYLCKIL